MCGFFLAIFDWNGKGPKSEYGGQQSADGLQQVCSSEFTGNIKL